MASTYSSGEGGVKREWKRIVRWQPTYRRFYDYSPDQAGRLNSRVFALVP